MIKSIIYQKVNNIMNNIKNYIMTSIVKTFTTNPSILVKSDIKNKMSRTGQCEDNKTGCLDYDYIKNHYRLIAANLSRQKYLDADPKAIRQIEFFERLKILDNNCNAAD